MRARYSILVIFIILLLAGTATANSTATVHGATYEWNTFELLENTLIEVNSTPLQSIVAKYGTYSFDLAPGNYIITAEYYQNDTLIYFTEEDISITDDGNYIIDLLLYPAYSEEIINEADLAEIKLVDENLTDTDRNDRSALGNYSILITTLALILIGAYSFLHRKKKTDHFTYESEVVTGSEGMNEELPSDLQEVLDIIIASGGRMTQKELRSKIKYSEGKVSLMLSDLEERGFVEKFRKGRGNVIILKDRK